MNAEETLAYYAKNLPQGQHKKKCPACSQTRRKNKNDPCLSINIDWERVAYKCHHCDWSGIYPLQERTEIMQLQNINQERMKKMTRSDISGETLKWLESRGISKHTAETAGIFSTNHYINAEGKEVPCIAFPYIVDKKERGAKIRAITSKGFSCTNALRSFFNIDNIIEGEPLVVVEGEMDALALIEAGIDSVVSVPNGAVAKLSTGRVDPREDKTFEFLWESRDDLKKASKIIIATDSDSAGQAMGEEIARRIGKDQCHKVVWPEGCKDANEVLLKKGAKVLVDIVGKAKPWPVAGVYNANHYRDQVKTMYKEGIVGGLSTGYENVDELYTTVGGQLTVVTGMPSHGKSEFVDQIMMNQAMLYGNKFALCSFENPPDLHIVKLVSKYKGMPFFEGHTPRMTEEELDKAYDFVEEHFTFLHHQQSDMVTLDDIIERLKIAVLRYGVRGAVIDPYNYIQKPKDQSETDWISEMLTRIRVFAQSYDIHIWFVAHPTKMAREGGTTPIPKGNDIAGSAAWFAKADFGLTVHRPDTATTNVEIHCWKCRYGWCGQQGQTALIFDRMTSRYREQGFQDRFTGVEQVNGNDEPDDDFPF